MYSESNTRGCKSGVQDKRQKELWEQEVSSLEDPATPAKSRSLYHQEIMERIKSWKAKGLTRVLRVISICWNGSVGCRGGTPSEGRSSQWQKRKQTRPCTRSLGDSTTSDRTCTRPSLVKEISVWCGSLAPFYQYSVSSYGACQLPFALVFCTLSYL